MTLKILLKGGPGSGHHGHAGRPGSVGGSSEGTGGATLTISADRIAAFVKNSVYRDIVYRGTSEAGVRRLIEGDFDPEKVGATTWQGAGLYFATQEHAISQFGDVQIQAVVDLRKPYIGTGGDISAKIDTFNIEPPELVWEGRLTGVHGWWTSGHKQAAIRKKWIEEGYDGFIQTDDDDNAKVINVFNPAAMRVIQ